MPADQLARRVNLTVRREPVPCRCAVYSPAGTDPDLWSMAEHAGRLLAIADAPVVVYVVTDPAGQHEIIAQVPATAAWPAWVDAVQDAFRLAGGAGHLVEP